jgi:hypothetical protein
VRLNGVKKMSDDKMTIIKCASREELERFRNATKKRARDEGAFAGCNGDTVVLKGKKRVKFVLDEIPGFDEEPLPKEAFDGIDLAARKAAQDMIE